MPHVEANGVRLYVEERGSGAAILGIHGTSSSALVWEDAATRLSGLGRTIIYDRRGCGRSERPEPYATSVAEHVADAVALVGILDAAPAIPIGRSYGGAVALGLALQRPDLVRGLVLLEPGDVRIDGTVEPWDAAMTHAVEESAATDPGRAAEAMFGSVLGAEIWAAWPADFRALAAANSPAVIAEVRGARLTVSTAELADLAVPTLLVVGEDSPPGFRASSERLASAIPGVRMEVVGADISSIQVDRSSCSTSRHCSVASEVSIASVSTKMLGDQLVGSRYGARNLATTQRRGAPPIPAQG